MSTPQCQEEQSETRVRARPRKPGGAGAGTPARKPTRARKRFTTQEQEGLERLRRAVQRGERSDAYPIDPRQDFVRWLIAEGRISDN
jgi:hypothetical protein